MLTTQTLFYNGFGSPNINSNNQQVYVATRGVGGRNKARKLGWAFPRLTFACFG